ncbi:DUF6612 family protein [Paenibacillus lentus]|uniref:DUF6612 family protein n=1 Tax=Paenibacillus lentus TaxID=1338368 RepID=UPI001FE3A43F|nr:DUF6612 family protein [Paenibacillus lentus]
MLKWRQLQIQKLNWSNLKLEDGDEYILSADLSGEGLKELAKNLMSQSVGGAEEMAAMMEMMNIKNLKISNAINKETYLPSKAEVHMEMDMEVEGQSIAMTMVMKSIISKQNEMQEIKVPQEVIDKAVQS